MMESGGSRRKGAASGSGSGRSAGSSSRSIGRVCVFWIGKERFALDVSLVREVVTTSAVVPVPLAHSAVLGLFNLRGTPIPLVDLAPLLHSESRSATGSDKALVIQQRSLSAALLIDRMDNVVELGGQLTAASDSDDAIVHGFLTEPGGARAVTILEPSILLQRLTELRTR
jgi:purine-binding chemotaxis protein CheW